MHPLAMKKLGKKIKNCMICRQECICFMLCVSLHTKEISPAKNRVTLACSCCWSYNSEALTDQVSIDIM